MSDIFSFQDGDKNITLRYDLSSPLARFVAQNNQELPTIYKRYAIQNVFRNEKPEIILNSIKFEKSWYRRTTSK